MKNFSEQYHWGHQIGPKNSKHVTFFTTVTTNVTNKVTTVMPDIGVASRPKLNFSEANLIYWLPALIFPPKDLYWLMKHSLNVTSLYTHSFNNIVTFHNLGYK